MKGLFTPNAKKITCLLLIIAVLLSFASCADASPGETTVPGTSDPDTQIETTSATEASNAADPTETKTTEPKETEPEETKGTEPTEAATKPTKPTEPKETEPKATEPPATQPPATEPPATKPVETTPPETQPPATEPPHNHNYAATSTVAPTCTKEGYTTYICTCGVSYTDNVVSATGHSWGDWTTTVEATSEAEGQQTRTCATCGAAETQTIAKLPAEVIDTAALEEYGRQYGANTYGFEVCVGIRAGYFPGYCCRFTSMADAYQEVAECVATTAEALIAYGHKIYVELEDGSIGRCRLDVEVCHDHDDIYYVWVYYG